MSQTFAFAWTCPSPARDLSDWEGSVSEDLSEFRDIVDYINQKSEDMDYAHFAEAVGGESKILDSLHYGSEGYEDGGLKIADDWAVSWHRSAYPDGTPIIFFRHSGIEHVFEPTKHRNPNSKRTPVKYTAWRTHTLYDLAKRAVLGVSGWTRDELLEHLQTADVVDVPVAWFRGVSDDWRAYSADELSSRNLDQRVKEIVRGFRNNEPMPYLLAGRLPSGELMVYDGYTRAAVAAGLGIKTVKAKLLPRARGKMRPTKHRNNGLSFRDEASTLNYHGHHPRRLALVDSAAPPAPAGDNYFAETTKTVKYGVNGRLLKKPRVVTTPGAGPGVVAFVDYDFDPNFDHFLADTGQRGILTIHYVNTRDDQRGRGHMKRLLDELLLRHLDSSFVDFGDVHSKTIWKYIDSIRPLLAGRQLRAKIRFNGDAVGEDQIDEEDPHPSTYMSFMSGDCWILAVALREVTGLDVYGASDGSRVHHAFVATELNGVGIDGRGQRSVRDLLSGCVGQKVVKLSDRELARWAGGGSGSPLSSAEQRGRACPRACSAYYNDDEWAHALETAKKIKTETLRRNAPCSCGATDAFRSPFTNRWSCARCKAGGPAVRCPGCNQVIYVGPRGGTECGGEGEGICYEAAYAFDFDSGRAEWEADGPPPDARLRAEIVKTHDLVNKVAIASAGRSSW